MNIHDVDGVNEKELMGAKVLIGFEDDVVATILESIGLDVNELILDRSKPFREFIKSPRGDCFILVNEANVAERFPDDDEAEDGLLIGLVLEPVLEFEEAKQVLEFELPDDDNPGAYTIAKLDQMTNVVEKQAEFITNKLNDQPQSSNLIPLTYYENEADYNLLCTDHPGDYDEWRLIVEGLRRKLLRSGLRSLFVPIKPEPYFEWLANTKTENSSEARAIYSGDLYQRIVRQNNAKSPSHFPLTLCSYFDWKTRDVNQIIQSFIGAKGDPEIPTWDDWCFLPIGAWLSIFQNLEICAPQFPDNGLAAFPFCGTWRYTQGIYSIDESLLFELLRSESPLSTKIPASIFYRLPEFCPYVHFEGGLLYEGEMINGMFLMLDSGGDNTADPDHPYGDELRIGLVFADYSVSTLFLDLEKETIGEGIEAAWNLSLKNHEAAVGQFDTEIADQCLKYSQELLPKLISVVMYLCSGEPDYKGPTTPLAPHYTKKKGALHLMPAKKPTVVTVGSNIGDKLRNHRANPPSKTHTSGGSKRAHIRRPHWHAYWVGPRNNRKLEFRWLHSIFVGDQG